MKTNILTLITITTAILLSSCEKEIEFNGEQSDPKLVINSLVEAEHPIMASISKSVFFLNNNANTLAPDDLVAMLYVNGNRIGEMTPHYDTLVSYDIWDPYDPSLGYVQKVYISNYCPAAGDIIKITASAYGFDEAEGTTSPLPITTDFQFDTELLDWHSYYYHPYFDELGEYEEDSLLKIYGDLLLNINIKDPNPGKSDCFRIHLMGDHGISFGENRRYVSFDYDDPIFGANISENEFFDASDLDTRPEGVFTDALFDGKSYQLKMKVYFEMSLEEEYDPTFFRIPFKLEHLSKEYYNYLNTCDQGDVALQIWAEPIQTYSNVTNGFGIVAGRAADTLWLALPLEEQ